MCGLFTSTSASFTLVSPFSDCYFSLDIITQLFVYLFHLFQFCFITVDIFASFVSYVLILLCSLVSEFRMRCTPQVFPRVLFYVCQCVTPLQYIKLETKNIFTDFFYRNTKIRTQSAFWLLPPFPLTTYQLIAIKINTLCFCFVQLVLHTPSIYTTNNDIFTSSSRFVICSAVFHSCLFSLCFVTCVCLLSFTLPYFFRSVYHCMCVRVVRGWMLLISKL